jgi:hypothetical protein
LKVLGPAFRNLCQRQRHGWRIFKAERKPSLKAKVRDRAPQSAKQPLRVAMQHAAKAGFLFGSFSFSKRERKGTLLFLVSISKTSPQEPFFIKCISPPHTPQCYLNRAEKLI